MAQTGCMLWAKWGREEVKTLWLWQQATAKGRGGDLNKHNTHDTAVQTGFGATIRRMEGGVAYKGTAHSADNVYAQTVIMARHFERANGKRKSKPATVTNAHYKNYFTTKRDEWKNDQDYAAHCRMAITITNIFLLGIFMSDRRWSSSLSDVNSSENTKTQHNRHVPAGSPMRIPSNSKLKTMYTTTTKKCT